MDISLLWRLSIETRVRCYADIQKLLTNVAESNSPDLNLIPLSTDSYEKEKILKKRCDPLKSDGVKRCYLYEGRGGTACKLTYFRYSKTSLKNWLREGFL